MKLKEFIIKFWPIIFILVVWFIFSSPYFINNKVPYSSTYQVNHFHPWSAYEKFWGPVKNGAMPDITDQIYPWRYFTIQTWKSGQIPFWNPNSFAGNPHLANYQSAVFSPFNILFFILPFVDAWSILVLIQSLLAGIFTYLLLREFKVSKTGSLISSISFMFSGFIVTWMAYGTMSMSIAFLPLALFSIEKFYNTRKIKFLIILFLSIPLSFFSGHFQISLYFFLFVLAFILYKSIFSKSILNTIYLILSIFLGLLVSSIQILPSIQFYLNSVRSEIFISGGIPIYYLVNIFAPDFLGNPVTRNDWFGYYAEWASFIGLIPFLLAIVAIFRRKRVYSLFFFLAGMVALILAVDSPLLKVISNLKIPVLSTSSPNRIIVLFSFSFAVLAGFGLDNLKELLLKKNYKKIIFPFIFVGFILITSWLSVMVFQVLPSDKMIIAKRNLILPTILFLGVFAGVFSSIRYKKLIFMVILFLLFSVSFDSLRFATKWMPFDPKEMVFADIPVIEGIKKHIGYGRIFGNLGAQVDTYYGFPGIEGYDPLYIGRYGEFIRASGTDGDYIKPERSVVKLGRNPKQIDRVLDLLGVNLIFHPVADTNQEWAYPVWKDKKRFLSVYKDSKYQLFKNNDAMERAELFYDYIVITKKEDILKKFYSNGFDFRHVLILEEDLGIDIQKGTGTATIASYTPNKIIIKANTNSPALLFLSDNYYPGWKAYLNGREIKIYRADYSFRAVTVPKGETTIEFIYKSFF